MAAGTANITPWKIREVLNQQIEPQCAHETHSHAPESDPYKQHRQHKKGYTDWSQFHIISMHRQLKCNFEGNQFKSSQAALTPRLSWQHNKAQSRFTKGSICQYCLYYVEFPAGVKLNIFYSLEADIRQPMRCVPIKGMENKYAHLAERCSSLPPTALSLLPEQSQRHPPCSFSFSSLLLSSLSFFMAAIVPFHHTVGWKRTLTHRWLSESTPPTHTHTLPSVPLGCKPTVWKLILWVHASALCMFMSNIWNKWHPLAGTTQINLVNSQARGKARATEKVAHLMADKRSACIIQLIPERGAFYAAFTKASTSQCTHGPHKHTNTRTQTLTQTQGLVFASWEKTGLPLSFCQIKYTVRAS